MYEPIGVKTKEEDILLPECKSYFSKHFSAFSVNIVLKSRMVSIQFSPIHENSIGRSIKFRDVFWKPWDAIICI